MWRAVRAVVDVVDFEQFLRTFAGRQECDVGVRHLDCGEANKAAAAAHRSANAGRAQPCACICITAFCQA